jgi:acetoin utilization deacetylase AcuC-like enzyme
MAIKTAYISHDDCLLHVMSDYHPESPVRLQAIKRHLEDTGLDRELVHLEAQPVTVEQLARAHSLRHIEHIINTAPATGIVALDPDTQLCPHSLRAAELAAGSLTLAVDNIIQNNFQRAFCAVRPPGHHAEYNTSMGFCVYNNIAVGVRHALAQKGIDRVAVLDFDVHHGNGTVDIFKDDPSVLVCSTFQHPFYPGRYTDIDRTNIVNTPLPAGTAGRAFRAAVERDWLPALERHRPQIIFVSAGFDAHKDDPLGGLNLVEEDFTWVTNLIVCAANDYARGRIISTLEGGYNPKALANSVFAHVSRLLIA